MTCAKGIIIYFIIISYSKFILISSVCDDGIYRLYNNRTTYTPDDLLRVTGIPQRCVVGSWGSLCSDDTNDPDIPSLLCQEFGYKGMDVIHYWMLTRSIAEIYSLAQRGQAWDYISVK